MSYDKLNQIYSDSITIKVGEHKAHIGGVAMPWDALNEKNEAGAVKLPKKIADSTLFANFQTDFGKSNDYQESHWKIHLSIHPYDMGKAWDLIYPMLLAHKIPCFKTTRMAPAEIMLEEMRKVNAVFLAKRALSIQDKNQAIQDILRVFNGMQITIYIEEGKEKEYNKLLEKIEPLLYKAGVRPGIIDKSDRAIGIYSSVRHIGPGYTSHEKVSGYKAIEIQDPFKSIKPVWHDIHIPWYGLNYTKHISKVKMTLQHVVDGKSKYDQGIITKREFFQICDVATEYCNRWQHLLQKTPDKTNLSGKDWNAFHHLKKWVDDGSQLIRFFRDNKTKQIKEAEDALLPDLYLDDVNEDVLKKLKRQNAQRHLITSKIIVPATNTSGSKPAEEPVKKDNSTTNMLEQLHRDRKQQFRTFKAKSEANLKIPVKKHAQMETSPAQPVSLMPPKAQQPPPKLKESGFFSHYSGRLMGGLGGASTGALLGLIAALLLTHCTFGLSVILIPILAAFIGGGIGYFVGNEIIDLPTQSEKETESIPTVAEPEHRIIPAKKAQQTAASLPAYLTSKQESASGMRMYDKKRPAFLDPEINNQKNNDEMYLPLQQKL